MRTEQHPNERLKFIRDLEAEDETSHGDQFVAHDWWTERVADRRHYIRPPLNWEQYEGYK